MKRYNQSQVGYDSTYRGGDWVKYKDFWILVDAFKEQRQRQLLFYYRRKLGLDKELDL